MLRIWRIFISTTVASYQNAPVTVISPLWCQMLLVGIHNSCLPKNPGCCDVHAHTHRLLLWMYSLLACRMWSILPAGLTSAS